MTFWFLLASSVTPCYWLSENSLHCLVGRITPENVQLDVAIHISFVRAQ